ncbi:outer membrane lipoprotein carrier protein LolA [Dongia sp.]|uniref:LolA family protein n=1 Tax=Dongia sp. TaxID=1977262 RepID=UPI0035AEEA7F
MRWNLTHIRLILCCMGLILSRTALADEMVALKPGDILRGQFQQERLLQGFDAPLRSSGSFVLAPGEGLIWRVEQPFAVTTLMSEKGLAQQSDGATTLNLPASKAPFMAGLYDMLTGALAGDLGSLEQKFAVSRSEEGGKWHLTLKPQPGGEMPIAEIDLIGATAVERVEIAKASGDRDILTFSDQKRSNEPLSADERTLLGTIGGP